MGKLKGVASRSSFARVSYGMDNSFIEGLDGCPNVTTSGANLDESEETSPSLMRNKQINDSNQKVFKAKWNRLKINSFVITIY